MNLFRIESSNHLDTARQLRTFIEKLPITAQLRFLAKSSYSRTFADTVIVFNDAGDYVLLKVTQPTESTKEIRDIPEWREDVAKRCVETETKENLKVISTPITIGIKKSKNSHPHPDLYGKDFYKYTMLITGYAGIIHSLPDLIWVKRKLLPKIFVPDGNIPHPQVYAYNDFIKYCSNRIGSLRPFEISEGLFIYKILSLRYSVSTMVVRMRHTRAHTANRRSHHALKSPALSTDKSGASHIRHKATLDGMYKGRSVGTDQVKKVIKKQKRAAKK